MGPAVSVGQEDNSSSPPSAPTYRGSAAHLKKHDGTVRKQVASKPLDIKAVNEMENRP